MVNKEVKIEKIPLTHMINMLVELYNQGVDYIDILGVTGVESDKLAISFTKDYMTEQGIKNFEEIEQTVQIQQHSLTEDDLNQLI